MDKLGRDTEAERFMGRLLETVGSYLASPEALIEVGFDPPLPRACGMTLQRLLGMTLPRLRGINSLVMWHDAPPFT